MFNRLYIATQNVMIGHLPKPILQIVIRIYHFSITIKWLLADMINSLLGRRDELMPPKRLLYGIGEGDFKHVGESFLQYFKELCGLRPDEKVLDVGCGVGRMAIPLTKYLDERGGYEGFDISGERIKWCQKKITPKYPNFRFQLADIQNKAYNPKGKFSSSEYIFPYDDESFDFVFLTSVFTHMMLQDMENYFAQVARVLKTGGRCLITFFLLNAESIELIDANISHLDFRYNFGRYRSVDEVTPESAIAYPEDFIFSLYEKHGFIVVKPILYGSWCGRERFFDYQDIIIGHLK